MKPERAFIAERALARHCPELLRAATPPGDLMPLLASAGARLACGLGAVLAPLTGHEIPEVSAEPPRACTFDELAGEIAPLAANSLLVVGTGAVPLLVSIEAAAVLRMVDRAFGGRGEAPRPMPETFPLSAELMTARLETLVIAALAAALGLGALHAARREGSLALLAPFAADTKLAIQRYTIAEAAGASWTLTTALPLDALPGLFDAASRPAPPRHPRAAANPAEAPYGGLELSLSAVLVDMAIPVMTLSALTLGQVLPVAIARSVPLQVGGKTIAHGTVGALDERVAVQITHAF